jgi:paxillin
MNRPVSPLLAGLPAFNESKEMETASKKPAVSVDDLLGQLENIKAKSVASKPAAIPSYISTDSPLQSASTDLSSEFDEIDQILGNMSKIPAKVERKQIDEKLVLKPKGSSSNISATQSPVPVSTPMTNSSHISTISSPGASPAPPQPKPKATVINNPLPMLAKSPQAPSKPNSTAINAELCEYCKQVIIGVKTMLHGKVWHPDHFRCKVCDKILTPTTYFERGGQFYCDKDYKDLFSTKCAYCDGLIQDKCINALGKSWHVEHFFCSQCGKGFENGLFMEYDGKAYCEEDYNSMFAPKCAFCDKSINGDAVNALGKTWHKECFACTVRSLFLYYIRHAKSLLIKERTLNLKENHIVKFTFMSKKDLYVLVVRSLL